MGGTSTWIMSLYSKQSTMKGKINWMPLNAIECLCDNQHKLKVNKILLNFLCKWGRELIPMIRRLFSPRARKKNKVCPFVLAFALFRSSNFLKFSKFQLLAYFKKSIQQRSIEVLKYRPVILTTVHASPPNRATLMPSNQNCTLIIIFAKHSFFYK